jgi:hypothetical protein
LKNNPRLIDTYKGGKKKKKICKTQKNMREKTKNNVGKKRKINKIKRQNKK